MPSVSVSEAVTLDAWQTVPDARSSDEERPVTIVERRDDGVTIADVDADNHTANWTTPVHLEKWRSNGVCV